MSITNRLLRNKMVGVTLMDNKDGAADPVDSNRDPFENVVVAQAYADVAKDLVTHVALTVGGVFAACKIVERICK